MQRILLLVILCGFPIVASTQEPAAPKPILVVNAGGPQSSVSALHFEKDRFFAAGLDKVVQSWKITGTGDFRRELEQTLRIPIGPGQYGAINAMAFSDDGRYMAVAGRGNVQGASGFHQNGRVFPILASLTEAMQLDRGTIHLIDRVTGQRSVLRGHKIPIVQLQFARQSDGTHSLFSVGVTPEPERSRTLLELRRWELPSKEFVELKKELDGIHDRIFQATTLNDGNDPHLVLSWYAPEFHIWRPQSGNLTPIAAPKETSITSMVHAAGANELLTAHNRQLHRWGYQNNRFTDLGSLSIEAAGLDLWLPQSVAMLNVSGRRWIAIGAVGFKKGMVPAQSRLLIYRYPFRKDDTPLVQRALWPVHDHNPKPVLLQASMDSRYLAVGGYPRDEIEILNVRELLGILVSRDVEHASFGNFDGTRQLLLRKTSGDRIVYAPRSQRLLKLAAAHQWTPVGPQPLAPASPGPTVGTTTTLQDAQNNSFQITTEPNWEISSQPWISHAQNRKSVIALPVRRRVAGEGFVRNEVRLFDATGGQQLRNIESHTGPVAFSNDGILLATPTIAMRRGIEVRVRSLDSISGSSIAQFPIDTTAASAIAIPNRDIFDLSPMVAVAHKDADTSSRVVVYWGQDEFSQIEFRCPGAAIEQLRFSRDGDYLAAIRKDKSVLIWGVTPTTRLGSQFRNIDAASFAKSEQRRGILLREHRAGRYNLLLDLDTQSLSQLPAGDQNWQSVLPSREVERLPEAITLANGDRQFGPVLVRAPNQNGDSITAVVTQPIRPVANQGPVGLSLYATDTGQLIRRLENHYDPVSISGDGAMLAAPSIDAKVHLYDLSNPGLRALGEITLDPRESVSAIAIPNRASYNNLPVVAVALHIRGQEPRITIFDMNTGIPVRDFNGHADRVSSLAFSADGKLLVSTGRDQTVRLWDVSTLDEIIGKHGTLKGVTLDREATVIDTEGDDLKKGDRLLRSADGKQWTSGLEFFDALWKVPPGGQFGVVAQRGAAAVQLQLPVAQAADERKPLFSMLVTDADTPDRRRWIAWSPIGPFETSSPDLLKALGWHFNTPGQNQPVAFVDLDQHKDEYYRSGLIKSLVRDRRVPIAARLPRPDLSLNLWPVAQAGRISQQQLLDNPLVRQPLDSLSLSLHGEIPLSKIESVTLSVDGAGPVAMVYDTADTWIVPMPAVASARGVHNLEVSVTTREFRPQVFKQPVQYQYVPAAPSVVLGDVPEQIREATMPLAATITSIVEQQPLDVIVQAAGFREAVAVDDQGKFRVDVPLRIGTNYVALSVKPKSQASWDGLETTKTAFYTVRYQKTMPPKIAVKALESQVIAGPQQALTTSQSKPQISIDVAALDGQSISKAIWQLNGQPLQLGVDLAGGKTDLQLSAELPLRIGPNEIVVSAQTATSDVGQLRQRIVYRPPLPTMQWLAPVDQSVHESYLPQDTATANWIFESAGNGRPFRVQLKINDQDPVALVDEKTPENVSHQIQLIPGANRLQTVLSNQWNTEPVVQTRTVYYHPQPEVIRATASPIENRPFFKAQVRIRAAFDLSDVTFDDVLVPFDAQREDDGNIVVTLPELSYLAERDAADLAIYAGPVSVVHRLQIPEPPAQDPPQIDFVTPKPLDPVTESSFPLEFDIQSDSEISAIQVLHQGKPIDVPLADKVRKEITLQDGIQRIDIVVTNAGGSRREELTINRIRPPAQIVLTSMRDSKTGNAVQISHRNGTLTVPNAQSSRVSIRGSVRWFDNNDPRLTSRNQPVHIWVNGFRQLSAKLKPAAPGKLIRQFEAELSLSYTTNRVKLELPNAQTDQLSHMDLDIPCDSPVRPNRLRLVIVGVGRQDSESLKEEVLGAFGVRRVNGKLKSKQFANVNVDAMLTGRVVSRSQIVSVLHKPIFDKSKRTIQGTGVNEVIALYYHGARINSPSGTTLFQTSLTKNPTRIDVYKADDLYRYLDRVFGAKILLTDLQDIPSKLLLASATAPVQRRATSMGYIHEVDEEEISEGLLESITTVRNGPMQIQELRPRLRDAAISLPRVQYDENDPGLLDALTL